MVNTCVSFSLDKDELLDWERVEVGAGALEIESDQRCRWSSGKGNYLRDFKGLETSPFRVKKDWRPFQYPHKPVAWSLH